MLPEAIKGMARRALVQECPRCATREAWERQSRGLQCRARLSQGRPLSHSPRAGGSERLQEARRHRPLCSAALRQRAEFDRTEHLWERGETCPVSTEGGTRRIHFVREGGGGGSNALFLGNEDSWLEEERCRPVAVLTAARGGRRAEEGGETSARRRD